MVNWVAWLGEGGIQSHPPYIREGGVTAFCLCILFGSLPRDGHNVQHGRRQ